MGVIKYRYKDTDIGINIGRYIDRSQFFFKAKTCISIEVS